MTTGLKIAFVIFAALIVIFFLIFFGILPGRREPPPPAVTLEFWGTGDTRSIWSGIITSYKEANTHVAIEYREIDKETYEEYLVNRLAENQGPDIFMLKNSWIEKHKDKIVSLPQTPLNFFPKDFRRIFVDVAADDLITPKGDIVGLPLYVDTPALFYNKDMFNSRGIAIPPKTWDDAVKTSKTLTELTAVGDIIRGGFAFGSAVNIEHLVEIISSLIFQSGDTITDGSDVTLGSPAEQALSFYTSFADPTKSHYSWNIRMKNSHEALADGTAAMAIGLASDIDRIKAKNPHLNLGVAAFPQQKNAATPVVYGTYYFPTVSKSSKVAEEAWKFLLYAASQGPAESYIGAGSRAPARRDLIQQGTLSPELEIFYTQALIAKSWRIPDERVVEALIRDMVETVILKTATASRSLSNFRQKLQIIMVR